MIPTIFYTVLMLILMSGAYSTPVRMPVPRAGQFPDSFSQHFADDSVSLPKKRSRDVTEITALERRSCPGQYSFGLDTIDVVDQRSASEDTVYISAVLAIAGRDSMKITKYYGQHGDGNFSAGITFENVALADTETAALSYLIVNQGHGSESDIEKALETAAVSVAEQAAQLATQVAAQDIAEAIGKVFGYGIGGILGFLVISIGETITDLITEGCDGYLGARIHTFAGAGVCAGAIQGTDVNEGTEDQLFLGFIPGIICSATTSQYDVDWFGRPS
jgi:hypothetical protein